MCIQWTRVLYSVVITRQSNPPISQFNSPCNEFTSFWSMFYTIFKRKYYLVVATMCDCSTCRWRHRILARETRTTCRKIEQMHEFEPHQMPRCFLEQETLLSLVLVGSKNRFEHDLDKQKIACFTIELK